MPRWIIWMWVIGIYIAMVIVSAFIFSKIDDDDPDDDLAIKIDVVAALFWPVTLPIGGIVIGGAYIIDGVSKIVREMVKK